MNRRTEILGLAALGVFYLGACQPDANQEMDTEAEAAEAPIEQRRATPFEEWDANQDQALQKEEFSAWATDQNVLSDWEGDQGLNREALHQRVLDVWDQNDDEAVAENEWRTGASTLLGDADLGLYAEWDANGDSTLDVAEIAAGLEARSLYTRVDSNQDARIDGEEIGAFFFDVLDINDDAQLDTTEWDYGRSTWFGEPAL